MSFKDDFENIVVSIAKEAMQQATSFADRIEALKALNTSYGLMMKHKKDEEPEDEGFTFEAGLPEVEEKTNGTTKVRSRPGGH